MNASVARVAWYRFRVTFRRRLGGYLSIVLLVGLLGGVAMGAVAGARRTQSSFSRFLASTNPSDLSTIYGGPGGYDPALVETISHLPHVKHVENIATLNGLQLRPDGTIVENGASNVVGSVDGEYFDQDLPFVTAGRLPNPQRPDEAATAPETARDLGLQLGSVITLGFYSNNQTSDPNFDPANNAPAQRVDVTLVGLGNESNSIVQDDSEHSGGAILLTPALTRMVIDCCANGTYSGLQLEHGSADVAVVETEIEHVLPPNSGFYMRDASVSAVKTDQAIKPQSIALGVFGGIAAIATLLIAGQVIGRQLRLGADELTTLRAVGAGPLMTMSDGLIGAGTALVLGTLMAGAVAVALSPLAPIGPVRFVDPSRGVTVDWTVLGVGFLVLTVSLSAIAAFVAYRQAPHRLASRRRPAVGRDPSLARAAASSGLPASAVAGIRFALKPGARANTVPVRSAIVGATLAVVVVTSTLTFGSSLHTLVSHPALYGWNWDYALEQPGVGSNMDGQLAAERLDHNPYVAGWTGASFENLQIDGRTIPILGEEPNASVQPPLLSGHGLSAEDEIVFGANTLAQLHKHVGDTVDASYGTVNFVARLRIVGTATLPAVGPSANQHISMGTGAIVARRLIPGSGSSGGAPGPNAIFVRLQPGANATAALQSLRDVASALASPVTGPVDVLSVQRPAEIVNYRSMGNTPALLGAALAVGAVSALGLTLIASVRRRRRDLALLKTLGFTRRQLAAVVAWQSSIAVGIGTVVGLPVGIAVGRLLWDLFAENIHVVPAPSVPAVSIALVAVGALVLANVVAAIPGRIAANTPTALLLRSE